MALGAITSTLSGQGPAALRRPGDGGGPDGLTAQERAQVQRLKAIDQKVRQHEAAHQAAGAGLTGGATYQYVRGPDGRQYAVAGEVSINTSAGGTPEATLAKARQIRAAALAPADPSPQDQAVAAAAALMENQARAEINRKRQEEQATSRDDSPNGIQGSEAQASALSNNSAQSKAGNPAVQAYAAADKASRSITQALGQAISTFA